MKNENRPGPGAPHDEIAPSRVHRRWDRSTRLWGPDAMEVLAGSSVTVIGLGGVGSYAAEALVRAAVGRLVLVDFDTVAPSNVNRQLQAIEGAYGRPKCQVLAERCRRINPAAEVVAIEAFYDANSSVRLLADDPDFVVDAIDHFTSKIHLLSTCVARGLAVVSSMGAAGKLDPTQVALAELSATHGDPMARLVRKLLRKNYGLGRDGAPTGIAAVYSPEPRRAPIGVAYDDAGFFQAPKSGPDVATAPERKPINGSAAFVTGVFGMVAASHVVRQLCVPK